MNGAERMAGARVVGSMKTALPLLALLGACASTAPAPFSAEGTAVAIGDGVRVGQLAAVPQVLLEDSRCPINARCIWAGRVVLSTRVYGPGFDETLPLTLGEPVAMHGTTVTLVAALPERQVGVAAPVPLYRFRFEGGR